MEITFNLNVTEKGDSRNSIRVFQSETTYKKRRIADRRIARRPAYRLEGKRMPKNLTIFTDGSCNDNRKATATSGAGIWCQDDNNLVRAIKIGGTQHSNQRAELIVVAETLRLNTDDNILIRSDSLTSLKGVTENIRKWEDMRWKGVAHADV